MKSIYRAAGATLFIVALAGGCASENTALVDKDPTRIICRDEPDTGSRLPKRTCKEAREWEAIAEDNQRAKRNLQRGTSGIPTSDVD